LTSEQTNIASKSELISWVRRIAHFLVGPFPTFLLGVFMVILGVATSGAGSDGLPLQDFIVVISIGAGAAAVYASVLFRDRMRRSHVIIAIVLSTYSVIRGTSLGILSYRNNGRSFVRLFTEATPPWVWAVVCTFALIALGMLLTAILDEETEHES
jgi:hypothetical protein